MRRKPLQQYKCLTFLSMLFIAIFLICDTTAFRMVMFFGKEIPLSGLVIPIVFALGDIIAEAYGYRITMKILFSAIICQFLYGVLMMLILQAPSSPDNLLNIHYDFAFQHIFRTSITSCFSVSSGMFVNAFLISKLKIYMNGKRFWLRTLLSSGFSEIVLCTVAYFILYTGLKDISNIITIIYSVWSYKMVVSFLINPLVAYIGGMVKRIENSDVYDIDVNYNPFGKSNDHVKIYANSEYQPEVSNAITNFVDMDNIVKNDYLNSNIIKLPNGI